jgi:phenylpropionate dioxygenase-like ring-hydroxylating dioxygenase large terminal subunit
MNAPENRSLKNKGPGLGPLPIDSFFTAEYHQLEKEHIFKKCWLRIGRGDQIPNVGDYFVKELESCDTSLIVVRGRDQKIRAFHNMCSHRSNRVAYETAGNTTTFKCNFHSWAYGLDGSLRAIPEEHLFSGLDKAENGLTEVACDIWEGFIFVNVDPQPKQTLREYLGEEIYNGFDGFFQKFVPIARYVVEAPCNWKIFLDAFVETYHFSTVHLPTAGDIVNSREFPNGRIDAVRFYGKHRIASATSNVEHTPTLAETLARKFGGNATLAPDLTKKAVNPPQINPKNLPDWLTDILIIFPMTNIQPLNGFYASQDYWPLSHNRTRWEETIYMVAPQTAAGDVAAQYNRSHIRDLIREDLKNLKMIQSNLSSGAKKYQILGEMEPMLRHSYKSVAEQVGSGW